MSTMIPTQRAAPIRLPGRPNPRFDDVVGTDWKEEPTKALKDVNVYDSESLYPTKQLAPWANTPGSVVPPLTLLNPHPPPNRDD